MTPLPAALKVAAVLLSAALVGCSLEGAKEPTAVSSALSLLSEAEIKAVRAGDLVFRRGEGVISRTVLSYDSSSAFSHVGLLVLLERRPAVVHVTPGEPARVQVEPLQDFAGEAASLAVYRLQDDELEGAAAGAARQALAFARDSLVYDAALNLHTDQALYCTELVWKAYLGAGIDLNAGRPIASTVPFISDPVLFPSLLLRSPYLNPQPVLTR